jgi:hypothetical protein
MDADLDDPNIHVSLFMLPEKGEHLVGRPRRFRMVKVKLGERARIFRLADDPYGFLRVSVWVDGGEPRGDQRGVAPASDASTASSVLPTTGATAFTNSDGASP